jgi:hypothetical protein
MKVREYTNIQNYIDSQENRLLEKKDLLQMVEPQHLQDFKKWSVKDLRAHFGITHKINGEYKNMKGYCFKCLTPLRPDYTQFENYCMDC